MARIVTRACVTALAVLCTTGVHAQAYPTKPVRLVVANAPGGADDFHGRLLGQKLTEALGQQFLVDNRSGSGGMVARAFVAKSAADGYTILLGSVSMAVFPLLYKTTLDPVRDFVPVSLLANTHSVMVVHPAVPAKTVKEFIALARSRAGKVNFGSTGVAGGPHLNAELFKSMAKFEATHIPYKGAGAGIYVDLLAGQLDFYIGPMSTALGYINSNKVRPLAVTTARRAAKLPHVPTMMEAGLPDYEMSGWYGIFAPAGIPQEVVATLNAAMVKQLATPELREPFINAASEPMSSTPEALAKRVVDEMERYKKIAKLAGIQPQ